MYFGKEGSRGIKEGLRRLAVLGDDPVFLEFYGFKFPVHLAEKYKIYNGDYNGKDCHKKKSKFYYGHVLKNKFVFHASSCIIV
jgi:hypothetical protein